MKLQLKDSIKPRSYQQSIFASSLNKNVFIVLPTGLGKTLIATLLASYYFNKEVDKKILFLAPTRPLALQQKDAVLGLLKEHPHTFEVLTGQVSPKKRENIYLESQFIFSTPQLIENDLINGVLSKKDISCVIFDEAHRATGNYAYCYIAEVLKKSSRFVCLSASPGTSKEEINAVFSNLHVNHVEVRSYEDSDVSEYISKTQLKPLEVELTSELVSLKKLLESAYERRIARLKELGLLQGKSFVTKMDLLELQAHLRRLVSSSQASTQMWEGISVCAAVMKLSYAIELVLTQEIEAAYTYLYSFFREGGDSSKAAKDLTLDSQVRSAMDELSELSSKKVLHPKLIKLKELVSEKLNEDGLKIIVFNQYRETAQRIVEELSSLKGVDPVLFIGQAKKGDVKMSQKEQKQVLDDFRDVSYNVLVSTSVGEEGLDIPQVDCVIFYEPIASAIRTIQRIGRTGRFNEGSAYVLITKGTRDVQMRYVANAKEKRMYKALDEITSKGLSKARDLKSFMKDEKVVSDRPTLYLDTRENNDLFKELSKNSEVEVKAEKLEVGDCVISEQLAIERKSKKDFVNSILNKRIFSQLIELAKNYRRPVLILEGDESVYIQRNVHPNVIRSVFCVISADLRIPIIETRDVQDTAQLLVMFAKRSIKDKKDHSLDASKKSTSEDEELEKFVAMIPRINISTSKLLLKEFVSLEKLSLASVDELKKCPGIGVKRAEFIYNFIRREYKNI